MTLEFRCLDCKAEFMLCGEDVDISDVICVDCGKENLSLETFDIEDNATGRIAELTRDVRDLSRRIDDMQDGGNKENYSYTEKTLH